MASLLLRAVAGALTIVCAAGVTAAMAQTGAPLNASPAPPPVQGVARKPARVVGHPDPLSLLKSSDPKLAAHKRLVFDFWRTVVNAGHVEAADRMLAESYIQHSPVLPTGRAAFKRIFSAVPRRVEVPELVSPPLIAIVAEGDLVAMMLAEDVKNASGSGTYTSTHFNLFRVAGGRLVEHWHSVQRAPGPEVPPPDKGGPQRVTGAKGAAQLALLDAPTPKLAHNKRLVFDFGREVVDAGGERPIQPFLRAPLVAMVAEGDFVVQAIMLEHPHPVRAGETYTTTGFDLFRIAEGRIAEHWDAAENTAP